MNYLDKRPRSLEEISTDPTVSIMFRMAAIEELVRIYPEKEGLRAYRSALAALELTQLNARRL